MNTGPLHCTAKFDPLLSLDCARLEGGRCGVQIKFQFLASGNTVPEAPDIVVAHRVGHDLFALARLPGRGVAVAAVVLHLWDKVLRIETGCAIWAQFRRQLGF